MLPSWVQNLVEDVGGVDAVAETFDVGASRNPLYGGAYSGADPLHRAAIRNQVLLKDPLGLRAPSGLLTERPVLGVDVAELAAAPSLIPLLVAVGVIGAAGWWWSKRKRK